MQEFFNEETERLNNMIKKATAERLIPVLFILGIAFILLFVFFKLREPSSEVTVSATDIVNKSASNVQIDVPTKVRDIINTSITQTETASKEAPPKTEVLPIMVFDTHFGVTADETGNKVVALYDTRKFNGKHRRYLSYVCSKEGVILPNEDNHFFLFGINRETNRPFGIRYIQIGDEMFDAQIDFNAKSIVLEMNLSDKVSFTLENNQQVILNIKDRKTTKLPCM